MRGLNASSANAGTWVVRVFQAEQDSFEYGPPSNRQTMHTFDCTLLSPDPAWYAQGTLKSPSREQIDAAKGRFLPGTLWRISYDGKLRLDCETKPRYVSAPQKQVILMGPPTRFEPVLQGTAPLPFVPIPQAQISNIMKLRDSKKLYDVAGVLVSGPTNSRTANTKRGSRRSADFQLVQRSKSPREEVQALDFTAWEGLVAQLEPLVGQYVALFKLEVSWLAPRRVSCEISWGASVAKLEPDEPMAAFIEEYTSGTWGGPVMVSTRWTPSEPAFDGVWAVLAQTDGKQKSILQEWLHGGDIWDWVRSDPAWWDASWNTTARRKLELICNLSQACKAFSVVYRARLRDIAMDWMETVLVRRYRGPGMGNAERLRLCAMRLSFPDYKADLKARLLWGSLDYPFDESESDWLCTSASESSDSESREGSQLSLLSNFVAMSFVRLGRRANNALRPPSRRFVLPLRQRHGETRRAYELRAYNARNWAQELGPKSKFPAGNWD